MSEERNNDQVVEATGPDFRETLPDQYKTLYPEFKKPEDFVKGYDELYRKMGNSVSLPKETASSEELAKFYSRLGRPEKPEGYNFGDNVPDAEFLSDFRNKAYESGMSQKQAKEVFDWYQSKASNYTKDAEVAKNEALSALKDRWGQSYEDKLKEVQSFSRDFMSEHPESEEQFVKYGNDPEFIMVLDRIKDKYAKEDYISSSRQSFIDKSNLQSEARKLMSDSDYETNEAKQAQVRGMYEQIVRMK